MLARGGFDLRELALPIEEVRAIFLEHNSDADASDDDAEGVRGQS